MTGEGKNKNQKLGVAAVTIHDLWEKWKVRQPETDLVETF
jgi:hypothetical protein